MQLGEIGLDNFPPYLMNRIVGRFNTSLQSEMSAFALTIPKMRTLAVLAVRDNITIGELAIYAVVEHSTMSRTLDSMEVEDLVRRHRDLQDNRATRIQLTESGRAAFNQIWPYMANAYNQMFAGISDDERRAFVVTLQKILKNVRKHDF